MYSYCTSFLCSPLISYVIREFLLPLHLPYSLKFSIYFTGIIRLEAEVHLSLQKQGATLIKCFGRFCRKSSPFHSFFRSFRIKRTLINIVNKVFIFTEKDSMWWNIVPLTRNLGSKATTSQL